MAENQTRDDGAPPTPTERRQTMLTVDELAERWNVSAKTIYLEIQKKRLPAVRLGRLIRVPIAVIESVEAGAVPR